jgi:hypothetical protein
MKAKETEESMPEEGMSKLSLYINVHWPFWKKRWEKTIQMSLLA